MGEQIVHTVLDALLAVGMSIATMLLPPTFLLLLLKAVVPAIGAPLLQAWGQLLMWAVLAPIRVVQFLAREAFGRRHR